VAALVADASDGWRPLYSVNNTASISRAGRRICLMSLGLMGGRSPPTVSPMRPVAAGSQIRMPDTGSDLDTDTHNE
jgi:hypothetical protein